MNPMALLTLMPLLSAHALPISPGERLQERGGIAPRHGDSGPTTMGEPAEDRTIFTVLSLLCMMVLSFLLGSRFNRLRRNAVMKRNLTSLLMLIMYCLVFIFIICTAAMVSGQGLYSYGLCFSATWICLIGYTFCKLVVYIFLVERIHVVRAPFVPRSRDLIYLSCAVLVIVSFCAVAINAYLSPIIEIGPSDGRCHTGIPGKASIPFMTVDILVDIVLTGVFFYLLRPVVSVGGIFKVTAVVGPSKSRTTPATPATPATEKNMDETAVQRNIRMLLRKSLIASALIMIPTIANMIQFYITQGKELAMVCMTLCVMDVSWDAVVLHYLTFGSVEAEKDLYRSTVASQQSAATNRPSVGFLEVQLATRYVEEENGDAGNSSMACQSSVRDPPKETSPDSVHPPKPV